MRTTILSVFNTKIRFSTLAKLICLIGALALTSCSGDDPKVIHDTNRYASLILIVEKPEFVEQIQSSIAPGDIYTGAGIAHSNALSHPFITVADYLSNDISLDDLKPFLLPASDYQVSLTDVSVIENKYYDELKCTVKSDRLLKTNSDIADRFFSKDVAYGFYPRLTIAYLKPGTGKKYLSAQPSEPITTTGVQFVYSFYDKLGIQQEVAF